MGINWTDWIKAEAIKAEAWIKAEYKSTGKSKLISVGLVIMFFIFVTWWLVTNLVEDSNRRTDRTFLQNNFDYQLLEGEYQRKLRAAEAAKAALDDFADVALRKKK